MENLVLWFMNAVAHVKALDLCMALLGLLICQYAIQRRQKRPIIWPVLGSIPALYKHMNEMYDWATDALNSCGGTFPYKGVWMGGAYGVVTSDPVNVEHILKTKFPIFPKGKYFRERFRDLLGDGIFNADDEIWRDQRRAANTELHTSKFFAYTMTTMENLVHRKLLPLLENLSREKRSIDFQDVLLRFTFDNICMAAFGVDPGCLGLDLPEVPFAKAFEQATEATVARFMLPPIIWKTMRYLDIGTERKLSAALKTVKDFAAKTVLSRKKELMSGDHANGNPADAADILSRLILSKDEAHPQHCNNYSDKYLQDFCISFILAGRDTTSVALAWFFWLLHKHPRVENKIFLEITGILKLRPGFNIDSDQSCLKDAAPFTADELKQMNYLHAALSESLRLYPSVPIDFKEVVEDVVLPDGSHLKKGARVVYSLYSMGRTESIWGKDCREFRPERWLNEDGMFVSESAFKYAVFNAGPRLCVGKKFAYVQMKWVAASVIFRYRVQVVDGHPVVPKVSTTLYMKHGLLVNFNPRNGP